MRSISPYMGRFAFSPRLWSWLRANAGRFDGMVMNGFWTFPGFALSFGSRRVRRPYGIFAHGALDPWFNRKYPLKCLKKLFYWPMQYAVLRDATAVFFTAETERDLARTSFRPNHWNSVVAPRESWRMNKPGRIPRERSRRSMVSCRNCAAGAFCCFWRAFMRKRAAIC